MKTARIFPAVLLWMAGGALNAAHCFFFPVSADFENFRWHIILAGALHSLTLALIPVLLTVFFLGKSRFLQLLGILLAGYLAGWISGIPLGFSIEEKWTFTRLWWPVRYGVSFEDTLMSPFSFFGLVGAIYFFFLCFLNLLRDSRPGLHLGAAALSGAAGSLWFWASSKPWYLCLIHGLVWGLFAGLGTWYLFKKETN